MTDNSRKICIVDDCPERYRCLDINTPTFCAVYRAIVQRGLKVESDNKKKSK